MNVYLHIGLHKTGSTYVQCNLFPVLKQFHYVLMPPWDVLAQKRLSETELREYKDSILESWDGKMDLIVSNEFFSGLIEKFSKSQVIIILDNLKLLFPEAQVILVLRNPMSYFISLYNFRVVSRGACTKTISRYFEKNEKYLLEKFDYNFLIESVNARFAKLNLIKYEQIKDNTDYMTFISKSLGTTPFEVSNSVKENISTKKSEMVNTHLLINRVFLLGILEYFPEGKVFNYLKAKYFKFKKTKTMKRVSKFLATTKFVSQKINKLQPQQEEAINYFVQKYNELEIS